jgi:hypothetical protein
VVLEAAGSGLGSGSQWSRRWQSAVQEVPDSGPGGTWLLLGEWINLIIVIL